MSTSFFAILLFVSQTVHAQTVSIPQNMTIEGRLYDAGVPLSDASVDFKLEVLVEGTSCVLYSEEHNGVNLGGTSANAGFYALPLGSGTNAFTPVSFAQAFSNNQSVGAIAGCSMVTLSNQRRAVRISVHKSTDSSGVYTALSPDTVLTSVPTALMAESAEKLGDKRASDLLQVKTDATTDLTQTNAEFIFSLTNFARLKELLNPSAALGFGNQRLTNVANPTAAQDAATKGYTDTKLAGQTIDLVDVAPGFGGGKVLTWDQTLSKWVAQSPALSGTAGGDLTGSFPNPSVANLAIGTSKLANDAVTSAKINSTGIASNRLLITDGSTGGSVTYASCANDEVLKFVTGTGWTCATVSSLSAVTSVAGKTGAVNLNAMDISGLGTAAVHNVGVGSTEIPQLDFSGKLAASTIPTFAGDVNGGINALTVVKLQGRDLAATAPNLNEVLRWNGSRWEPQALTDAGITALTGDISASGNGSVTATLANGVVTTPKLFSNPGANRLIATDSSSGATLTAFTCNLNEIMQWTASGWTCVSVSTAMGGAVALNGGNTFGSAMSMGTNDAQNLNFKTAGSTSMTILSTGQVGIGITSPARLLSVGGPIRITPSTLPSSPAAGDLVFDSAASNTLKYHNGSGWILLGTGFGDFMSNGSVPMIGALRVPDGTVGAPSLTFASDTNTGFYRPGGDTLAIVTGGSDRLTFGSGGTISMSSTSLFTASTQTTSVSGTESAFDISRDAVPTGASSANVRGLTAQATWNASLNDGGTSAIEGVRAQANVNGSGNSNKASALNARVSVGSGAGTVTNAFAGQFAIVNSGGATPTNAFGVYIPQVDGVNRWSIYAPDVNAPSYFNGWVGIGVSSPQRLLHVAGPMHITPAALPASPFAGDLAFDSAGNILKFHNGTAWQTVGTGGGDFKADGSVSMTGALRAVAGSASNPGWSFAGDTGTGVFAPSSGAVAIANSGTEHVRITSGGNVGIGTTNPASALDVYGAIIADMIGNGQSSFFLGDSGTTRAAFYKPSGSSDGRMWVSTVGDVMTFKNDGTGYVGIGTTGPSRLLQVAGAIRLTPTATPSSPAAGDLYFDSGAANALKYFNGSNWTTVTTGTGYAQAGVNSDITTLNSVTNMNATAISIGGTSTNYINVGGNATGNLSATFGASSGSSTTTLQAGSGGLTLQAPASAVITSTRPIVITPSSVPGVDIAGMMVFDSGASNQMKYNNGSSWVTVGTGNTTSSGTNNYLAKFNGASSLVDSVIIESSGKVGIGTSSPNRLLEVSGPIRILPSTLPGTPAAGDLALDSGAGNALKFHDGSNWRTLGTGTGDLKADGTISMTGNLRLNGNYISNDGGNEGLVVTNIGEVGLGTTGTAGSPALFFTNSSSTGIYSPSSGVFNISASGTNVVNIANSGMTVNKPLTLQGVGSAAYLPAGASSAPSGTQTVYFNGASLDNNANLVQFTSYNAANTQQALYIGAVSVGGTTVFAPTLVIGQRTGAASYAERLRIDSGGNLGIGVTNPARMLNIAGAIRINPSALPASPSAGDLAFDLAAGNFLKFHNGSSWQTVGTGNGDFLADGSVAMTGGLRAIQGSASAPGISFAGETDNGMFMPASDNLALATTGAERLRILANGNIGIGNTNPSSLLHVGASLTTTQVSEIWGSQNIRVHGSSNPTALTITNSWGGVDNGSAIEFKALNSGSSFKSAARIAGPLSDNSVSSEKGYLAFSTMNTTLTEKMRLTHDGRLVLGMSNPPQAKLEVAGQIRSALPNGNVMVSGGTSIDWNDGHAQESTNDCSSPITLQNLLEGATYTLAISDPGMNTCVFAGSGVSFVYYPGNGPRNVSSRTLYNFQRINNVVYVSWVTGFQ